MSDHPQAAAPGNAAQPPVSAHFINNVLAAAASYIEDDPDYARDVLAELGQFLSYRLRDDTAPVSAAQELAQTATYLRLQQARFPDRIVAELPEPAVLAGRQMPAGTIEGPVAELLGRRLRERAGRCRVALRPAAGGLALEVSGDDDEEEADHVQISLDRREEAAA